MNVSPKHGLNPTMPVCAWCGKEKNEIALLGHMGDYRKGEDFEAPRHCILDYEPCDKCREGWSQGVAIIEVTTTMPTPRIPPIQKGDSFNLYPTMRMVVITVEGANEMFSFECEKGKTVLFEDKAFEECFGEALKKDAESKQGEQHE